MVLYLTTVLAVGMGVRLTERKLRTCLYEWDRGRMAGWKPAVGPLHVFTEQPVTPLVIHLPVGPRA